MKRTLSFAAAGLATMLLGVSVAQAAPAPPVIDATWVSGVSPTAANLRAEITPEEAETVYRFQYTTEAAFLAAGFAGATEVPLGGKSIGSDTEPLPVLEHLSTLLPATSYRFRVLATNSEGSATGPVRALRTDEVGPVFSLPDNRGWEMVSPVEKNGGEIQGFGEGFGANFGGDVVQAATQGGAVTYTSNVSFANAQGSPGASQYVSARSALGWGTDNVTVPALSGSYPESPTSGVPFQLFSTDLSAGLISNGRRCRNSASSACPVENPPLPGSGAPAGYRNYYVGPNGGLQAVLSSADLASLALAPEDFELAFAGASPDLAHVALSTCAALTADATELPGPGGECDPAKQNLYLKSGSSLKLINLLPGDGTGTPGSSLAAQSRAISSDGSRVYWSNGANLYLRDGAVSKQVDVSLGGGGRFETASSDGSIAYFSKGGHLYRYVAATATSTDLTPGAGLQGVLGASDNGALVYYLTGSGLFLDNAGVITQVAPEADAGNYPPTSGSARVEGQSLLFVSSSPATADLVAYDNHDAVTGAPQPEAYLYTASGDSLACVSCNPSGERPLGATVVPGARSNGSGPAAVNAYKPQVLSVGASRVFFDTADALSFQDNNHKRDVYQWEAPGAGGCAIPTGCVGLISSGRAEGGATFLDASADGSDAFFLTDESLVPIDPGATDVYDARVNGGLPLPVTPIPCFGDACQPLPPEPEDPTPGTLRTKAAGNPPAVFPKAKSCKKGQVKKKGKCVKKKKKPQRRKQGGRK